MNEAVAPMTTEQFVSELESRVEKHAMLKHPFYQRWSEGTLTGEDLAEYTRQYYAHVRAFPTYVSAVHSRCGDEVVRKALLENLIEEERGADNHPELWLRFAEACGAPRDSVRSAQLLPSTRESVEVFTRLTQSSDFREGIAALFAYESQIPEVARTKREGLTSFYGIKDENALGFFLVHESADVFHRSVERDLLVSRCATRADQERAIDAAENAAKALWHFLDGVYEKFVASC